MMTRKMLHYLVYKVASELERNLNFGVCMGGNTHLKLREDVTLQASHLEQKLGSYIKTWSLNDEAYINKSLKIDGKFRLV